MPRIFLHLQEHSGKIISITGEKAHYLRTVLRCREGEALQIFDGSGLSYNAIIKSVCKKEVTAEILTTEPSDTESHINIVLVQGLLKGEKMELVIQKTTELGVREIIPAITERSQVRATDRAARWLKIAENAARQSGRTVVPAVREPVSFRDIFSKSLLCGTNGLIFWEESNLSLKAALSQGSLSPVPIFPVFIGPEGGFTKEEIRIAEENGLVAASLGKRILRAETATISAIAIIQTLLGDI